MFDGPGENENFGLEQVTGNPADRYAFHRCATWHYSRRSCTTTQSPADLRGPMGAAQPVLDRLDPLLRKPVDMSEEQFESLVDFVRNGLLDPAAEPRRLRRPIPEKH